MPINSKLKVIIIPAWYPNIQNKLAGNLIQRIAETLSKNISVIVFHIGEGISDRAISTIEISYEKNVTVCRIYYRRFENKNFITKTYLGIQYIWLAIVGYTQIIRKFGKPDINHVQVLTRSGVVAFFLKIFYKIPYIITERWSRYLPEDNSYKGFLRKITTQIVVNNSLGLTTVSEVLRKALKDFGLTHENFQVVGNAIDTEIFKIEKTTKIKTTKFIHVSTFGERDKNTIGIIKAASELGLSGFEFDLYLIGGCLENKIIEEYVNERWFGLVHVYVIKNIPSCELVKHYQDACALIIFSNYETFCAVIAEAHCCGLPVIATNVAAIPELVNTTNGILVEPQNIEQLKSAIKQFLNNEIKFDRAAISNKARKQHCEQVISNKYLDFYDIVLRDKSGIHIHNPR